MPAMLSIFRYHYGWLCNLHFMWGLKMWLVIHNTHDLTDLNLKHKLEENKMKKKVNVGTALGGLFGILNMMFDHANKSLPSVPSTKRKQSETHKNWMLQQARFRRHRREERNLTQATWRFRGQYKIHWQRVMGWLYC